MGSVKMSGGATMNVGGIDVLEELDKLTKVVKSMSDRIKELDDVICCLNDSNEALIMNQDIHAMAIKELVDRITKLEVK